MQLEDKAIRQERLYRMLLTKRAELATRIREELGEKIAEDLESLLGPASDLGDLSSLHLERDVKFELLTMYTENMKDIDEALDRVDEGTYGICTECGERIGEKRLQAMPFAICCLECQREKEKLKETGRG
ncbi:MAG: transcriptional regulator, TraR/DksA family protein, partial [Proteobacteria bacterium]|nr:transcriptional regulator, TraR/DksA family protein [Pseudomonadota bacterium]